MKSEIPTNNNQSEIDQLSELILDIVLAQAQNQDPGIENEKQGLQQRLDQLQQESNLL